MRFIRSIRQCLAPEIQSDLTQNASVAVTIGNFDGMHLGHQALFSKLETRLGSFAEELGTRPRKVLMTFIPHPRSVLAGESAAVRDKDPQYWSITTLSRKIELASQFGFDYFFAVKFSKSIAALSPEEFAARYLVSTLHAKLVVVGYDWAFGRARQGNVDTLREIGVRKGFEVEVVPPVRLNDKRVSSSLVRSALIGGGLEELTTLLGRSFEVTGKVRHGQHRGRTLGFRTANLKIRRGLLPPDGVYASSVRIEGETVPGVTNIGFRPTFDGVEERLVETHIIDGKFYDLYGKRIGVRFVERLRGERKFAGVEELKAQIYADVEQSKRVLAGGK